MVLFCSCKKQNDPELDQRQYVVSATGINIRIYLNNSPKPYSQSGWYSCNKGDILNIIDTGNVDLSLFVVNLKIKIDEKNNNCNCIQNIVYTVK